uniref:Uncharacterized protein n=1 Tax=Tanacetum cinerariifolium TaxID=118510 RepID=A0A6L2J3G9_TANCI|nr:hypothetical protein [Tanacetum cinerariifolium]
MSRMSLRQKFENLSSFLKRKLSFGGVTAERDDKYGFEAWSVMIKFINLDTSLLTNEDNTNRFARSGVGWMRVY